MEAIRDFEDILELLQRHHARYLIVGGLAFVYHAKPRFTKDIDLWVASDPENVSRVNRALAEFGSPYLLDPGNPAEILQIGVAPNRIDVLRDAGAVQFEEAWPRRIEGRYGRAPALWIAIEDLLAIKGRIDHPRHQEDARVLRLLIEQRRAGR